MVVPPERDKIIAPSQYKELTARLGELATVQQRISEGLESKKEAIFRLRQDFGEHRGSWQRFKGIARVIRLVGQQEPIHHACELEPGYYQLDGWKTIKDRSEDFDVAWLRPQVVERIEAFGVPFLELEPATLAEVRQAERSAQH
jgi:hypothetical protein